jgi:hypothetical protein
MTQTWEHIGPGRYALEFHGHVLQAIRNPDREEQDQRPYIAVVDRVPLTPPEWSLARAKTKAMRHVLNKLGKPKPKGNAFKPELVFKNAEAAHLKSATVADLPPPEPEPPEPEPPEPNGHDLGITDFIFDGLFDLPESEFDPEPLPGASPEATVPLQAGTLVITGTITNPDLLAGLNEIRQLLDMMREHAEVKCQINLPPVLDL